MWPFRRRRRPGPVASGSPGGDEAMATGWRHLPPIQRVVTASPRTVEVSSFEASLATRRNPAMVGPLEHAVLPDAPAGIAHGLAAVPPSVQRTGEESVAATVERRPTERRWLSPAAVHRPVSSATAVASEGEGTTTGPAPVAASGEPVAEVSVSQVADGIEGEGEPVVGRVELERPFTTSPPPVLPLLRLPSVPASGPAVQRAVEQPDRPPPAGPTAPGQSAGGADRAAEPTLGARPGTEQPEPAAPGLQRAADEPPTPVVRPGPPGPAG